MSEDWIYPYGQWRHVIFEPKSSTTKGIYFRNSFLMWVGVRRDTDRRRSKGDMRQPWGSEVKNQDGGSGSSQKYWRNLVSGCEGRGKRRCWLQSWELGPPEKGLLDRSGEVIKDSCFISPRWQIWFGACTGIWQKLQVKMAHRHLKAWKQNLVMEKDKKLSYDYLETTKRTTRRMDAHGLYKLHVMKWRTLGEWHRCLSVCHGPYENMNRHG